MSNTQDLIKLYSKHILALASNIPKTVPISKPMGSAKKRSPLCGSNIQVALNLSNGVVSDYSQDVKACALGQASASILGANIIGLSLIQIQNGRNQLFDMLTKNGPIPDAPFTELKIMQSAKQYKNRHASIMLVFDATLDAIDQIQSKNSVT